MNFCSSKGTRKRLERGVADQKEISVEQVSAKKELSELSEKQTNFLKRTKELNRHFTRKIQTGQLSAGTSLVIQKCKLKPGQIP